MLVNPLKIPKEFFINYNSKMGIEFKNLFIWSKDMCKGKIERAPF